MWVVLNTKPRAKEYITDSKIETDGQAQKSLCQSHNHFHTHTVRAQRLKISKKVATIDDNKSQVLFDGNEKGREQDEFFVSFGTHPCGCSSYHRPATMQMLEIFDV